MWTFEILNKTKIDENTIELEVKFSNGVKTFQRNFYAAKGTSTRTWLENEIKREVAEFENKQAFNLDIKKGVFTLTPEITPPAPTLDQLNKIEFFNKLAELEKKQKLIDMGIISENLTVIKNRLIELYKEEWIVNNPL